MQFHENIDLYVKDSWVVAYKSLKTKEKSGSGRGHLQELFIKKFQSQFKWGFAKVVVTRTGRSQEWLRGELPLYLTMI